MASKQTKPAPTGEAGRTPAVSGNAAGAWAKSWAQQNKGYILAFFIPIVLMYIAYSLYGMYPFGEESVLALDLNAQYVYYFESLRDAFWGHGSAFYDWSRNLSGGFMGVIGYYLASPFTLIVMILPRKMILTSLKIMILCKIGSASVTFSYYLRQSKKLPEMQATMFGVLFSMCAYMVIQTIDPMWLDGLVFLPLVALGTEHLIDDGRKVGFIVPLALMFVANFYIGYMIGIFTAFYFVYYLFFGKEGGRGKASNYGNTLLIFAVSTLTAVMLAAFMLLPVVNALRLGKFEFTDPDYSFKVQFEPVVVLAQLLTCQYDSVNVQGSPEIYCGILAVVLLPLFFLNSKITLRQKFGYGFLLIVMFFSMYIKPADMWWHGGQVPNWLPFRYSFIISFLLLSMAAETLKNLEGVKPGHMGGVFFGIMAVVLYIEGKGFEHLDIMKSIWLTIGLAGVYLLLLYGMSHLKLKHAKVLPIVMAVVICAELTFNALHSMKCIEKEVAYSSKASYESFIAGGRETVKLMEEHDDGLYRSDKTFSRCVNDNEAFGLKGITHSSSVMNAPCLTFIETLGYCTRSYYSRYDGTTELADSLLGIKYVLDRDNAENAQRLAEAGGTEADRVSYRKRFLLHDAYTPVDSYTYKDYGALDDEGNPREKTFTIYENPNALPIGYMVDDDLLRIDHLGNDNPFNSQNVLLSTMVGGTAFDSNGAISGTNPYYRRIETGEPVLGAVTLGDYNGQKCYTRMDSGDPTVDYRFTVDSTDEIFFFLKTENEQSVNLWLGVMDENTGDYKFTGYGQYFETHNYSVLSLGKYTPGTQLCLRLTVLEKDNATIIKEPYFYYFDRELFQRDIAKLQAQTMTVTKFSDTSIRGEVQAQSDQILFTSIPYEPGWTIKVDGKKVDTKQCLKAMIYIPLEAGSHRISMSYTPPGFVAGVILFIIGLGITIVFWRYDRKNNKVLRERAKEKKAAAAA